MMVSAVVAAEEDLADLEVARSHHRDHITEAKEAKEVAVAATTLNPVKEVQVAVVKAVNMAVLHLDSLAAAVVVEVGDPLHHHLKADLHIHTLVNR